ncbi:MAG: cytochrome c oxidase assembly protein [Solirubrobacterales bacterium]|nr:cytochrome c oxidase assembly protein [Solirubrobacterales bacterium]
MSTLALPLAAADVVGRSVPVALALLCWLPYHRRAQTLARSGREVPGWRQACYAAGILVLAAALSPPVDALADQLLVAHMAEHLLIGDVAALLIVLGLTGPLLAPLLRRPVIARLRLLAHPVVAVLVWMVNFYVWHLPVLYQAALRHDAIHALQHITFLAFGTAMWMGLLGPLPKPAWFGNAARLIYIIVVRLAGTVLANAMLFSGSVWYPIYRAGDAHWHIGAVADQIAAASVMMVEESLLTLGLFCWLFLKVAREADERQRLLDYAAAQGMELDERRAARAVAAGRGEELWERLRSQAAAT